MENDNRVVVSYHRVSPTIVDKVTIENDDRPKSDLEREAMHKSLVSSIEKCRKAAKLEDNEIQHDYIDEYKSGANQANMTDFLQMMEDAKDGKIKRIYVRRVNRFGRNRKQSMDALLKLEEYGVSIFFVENGLDTEKPFGKSIVGILIELAEMERLEIRENTKRGIQKAKEDGVKFGCPKKEIDVKMLRQVRIAPVKERSSWKRCEETFHVSRTTLIKRLKECGYWDYEKGCVI